MIAVDQGEEKEPISSDDEEIGFEPYETKSNEEEKTFHTTSSNNNLKQMMVMDKLVVRKQNAAMAVRWCLDRDAEMCFGCRDDFSLFVRKHHCRSCGGVFCASCSRFQKTLPLIGYDTPTRVCGFCYHDHEHEASSINADTDPNTASTPLTLKDKENGKSFQHRQTKNKEKQRNPLTTKNVNSNTNSTSNNPYKLTNRHDSTASMASRDSNFCRFSVAAPTWVEDDASDVCQQCATEFAMLVWRHHCRGCGGLFCWTCTERRLALPHYGYVSPVRVCVSCSSPQIKTITAVPTSGGRCIIVGHNLGNVGDSIIVEVRSSNNDGTNVKCTDVQVFAEDEGKQLICTVPSGTGIRRPMRITVNALRGMSTFTYSTPSVNKTSSVSTEGGDLILTGENFGEDIERVLVEWCDREVEKEVDREDVLQNGQEARQEARPEEQGEKKESEQEEKNEFNETNESLKNKSSTTKKRRRRGERWRTCETVEMLVPHKVLRVRVGAGTGTHAALNVNVTGQECRATYNHDLPLILESTPGT